MDTRLTLTTMGSRLTAGLLVSAVLVGCTDDGSTLQPSADPQAQELHGIWERTGYGDVLVVDEMGGELYQYTRAGCLEADFLSNFDVAQQFNEAELSNDSAMLTTNPTENLAYEVQFERLDALPASCSEDALITEQTPTATFEHLWHSFNDHYAFFEKRGVDWDAQYNDLRPLVNDAMSEEDLFDVIEELLTPLDDGHVNLGIDGDDFDFAEIRGANAVILENFPLQTEFDDIQDFANAVSRRYLEIRASYIDGALTVANGSRPNRVLWGTIGGQVGYLRITSMSQLSTSGDDAAANLEAINNIMPTVMTDLQNTSAMIIDVRANPGGEDVVSLAIASYFTDMSRLAVSKFARSHAGNTDLINALIEPANDAPYLNPVAVLASPDTASAAEIFVMAMSALPQVTLVGESTNGILSDTLSKSLPNGWEVSLSNEVYTDAFGFNHEVSGVPAQIDAPTFSLEAIEQNRDAAIDAALTSLGFDDLSKVQ